MPEMVAYCGKRYEVWKRSDKTCDEAAGGSISRVTGTVHLKELRCNGSAHGDCDAGCLLFWREEWLKRVDSVAPERTSLSPSRGQPGHNLANAAEVIARATRSAEFAPDGHELFSCQATEISRFSKPLPWWDLRQYVRDLVTRNVGVFEFLSGLAIGVFNKIQDIRNRSEFGKMAGVNKKTPRASLDLVPGDLVQIKSKQEILSTLDRRGRNAGLAFRPVMTPNCGKAYRVVRRVHKIIDPRTRKLIQLTGNSVILEGVVCSGKMRRFCPRMVYTFWRDIWLTPLEPAESPAQTPSEQVARASPSQNEPISV